MVHLISNFEMPPWFLLFSMCSSKSIKDLGGDIYIILKYCEPILNINSPILQWHMDILVRLVLSSKPTKVSY
jgi:hypothetical protein